jgi:O-methyltransferase
VDYRQPPETAPASAQLSTSIANVRLDAYPSCRGILFDQPQVVEEAPLHSRMERVGGDFFAEIPIQATAYLLRWIIHDWDDDKAISILENVRKAARHGARLLLVESVIPETAEPLQLRRERIWREKMSTRAAREENESCP